MYVIEIVGPRVIVRAPTGAEYSFGGYGDYGMKLEQHEVGAICEVLRNAGAIGTASTLTECVRTLRLRLPPVRLIEESQP